MKETKGHPKLYYAAGPGDVVSTFRHWLRGENEPQQLALTYSEQFFNLLGRLGGEGWVVSSCERQDLEHASGLTVENRPRSRRGGALGYWFDQFAYGLGIVSDLLRLRPDIAVIAEGTCPWSLFWIPRAVGIKVVPSMHCVLWPPAGKPSFLRMTWLRLEGLAFRFCFDATLCASEVVSGQIQRLAPKAPRLRQFLPTYRLTLFAETIEPPAIEDTCRLLYAGRVETDKGIFDLLDAFTELNAAATGRYTLDVCGNGSALDALRSEVEKRGLQKLVFLRGHCAAEILRRYLGSCHLVIVPTTSRFVEGFNQVVAEGVLAGRPVIATSVCPSAHLFLGAVRMVEPDRPDLLVKAIGELAEDKVLYDEMRTASFEHRRDLFSFHHSWEKTLADVVNGILPESRRVTPSRIGYLVPQFPSQTHAFFWREISAIRQLGTTVTVLSTREPEADSCSHAFAPAAREEAIYLTRIGFSTWALLLARPLRLLKALAYIASLGESTLAERLRALILIPCAARLVVIAREKGLRHIHIHSCADAAHVGALAKCLGDLPYSLTLHGDLPVYGKDHGRKFAGASWVSAVTRPLQEQIVEKTGFPISKVPVIWMGVDVMSCIPKSDYGQLERPFRVVTVARLIAQKGHQDALNAIAILRAQGVRVSYDIAGSGSFESEIRAEIERLGLHDVVRMCGNLSEDEVRCLLQSADAFVLPSYGLGEAAPVSVMEAMACGLPVVSTRIGGTPDMICHLEDGWLVPQRDVAELAKAIGALATNLELCGRLGAAARETALAFFDHRKNAAKLLDWMKGTQINQSGVAEPGRQNLLLVMEQCNPLWPSVPRVAFEIYRHLREITGVTLVTHARNREGLMACFPEADIHFIEESPSVRNYYHVVSSLVGGRGTNWPLLHALGYPVFAEFDRKVGELFGERVRGGEFRAVMATTPILPRYPYSIAKFCETVPFILGPVNGGLPFPKGFGKIALQEHAAFNFLRRIGRLLPGYADTYQSAARILAGSEYTLGWLQETFPAAKGRMVWMPENGVSKRFFAPLGATRETQDELRLLFAGRLVAYKGADILLDAMARIRSQVARPLRLRIVGDGPMRDSLESQAARLGLSAEVEFAGLVSPEQMPEEFLRSDLFCFPSIREFGGAVVLESMAAGTPCVVVDHGGIGEYVTPACGIKIRPESREYLVIRFADALIRLSADQGLLAGMSVAARIRAEEFSWEAKVRRIEKIVSEAITERAGPSRVAA